MEAFSQFSATAIPVDIANCDTDQIIPARYLRRLRSDPDYPRFLFHDLRFNDDGSRKPEFIYNRAPFDAGRIIVADVNWGCGSSREAAVYALAANHIRAVIAPSFGDIHYNNCMKNGVLPVRLERAECDRLRRQLHAEPDAQIHIDLQAQCVTGPDGQRYAFQIDGFDKHRMLNGLDDIALTLENAAAIDTFEAAHAADYDWLD